MTCVFLLIEEFVISFWMLNVQQKIYIRVASVVQCKYKETQQILYISLSCKFSHEAMTDLIAIMSTLVDSQGRILIEGVYDEVAPLLPEEEQLYKPITFDTVRLIHSH